MLDSGISMVPSEPLNVQYQVRKIFIFIYKVLNYENYVLCLFCIKSVSHLKTTIGKV